jgi:serine/threonine protein kinase
MTYLHNELKYAHRDLKPANIFISMQKNEKSQIPEMTAKVGDFGSCRKIEFIDVPVPYPDENSPGTPGFQAPETDEFFIASSDVYSFGIVMFLALLGRTSWKSEWRKTPSSTPLLTPELKLDLSEQFKDDWKVLEDILLNCLEYDWKNRRSFNEVTQILNTLIPQHSNDSNEWKEI